MAKWHGLQPAACVCCGRTVEWVKRGKGGEIAVDPGYFPLDIDVGKQKFVLDNGEIVFARVVSERGQEIAAYNGETLERGRIPHFATCFWRDGSIR